MPDGSLTLKLSDETASRIAEKAKALGMPVEHLAAMLLDQHFLIPATSSGAMAIPIKCFHRST